MTSPEDDVPSVPRRQPPARHRSTPSGRQQATAPPAESPRPEPERFNGFVPRGDQPAATAPAGSSNRTRRTGSSAPAGATAPGGPASPGGSPGTVGSASELVERLQALGAAQRVESRSRWTRRRRGVTAAIAAGVIVVLVAAGLIGYKLLAPYYGLGYRAGGSATIESVKMTVTKIDCGLSDPPFGNVGHPRGKYCGVTISAHNYSKYHTAFINLRAWTSRLDVDLTIAPVAGFLPLENEVVNTGQTSTFNLTYDVPDGARMLHVNLNIDDHIRHIAVS